jgi:hypothetical protein
MWRKNASTASRPQPAGKVQTRFAAQSRTVRADKGTMAIHWNLISNFAIALLAVVNPVEKIPLWVKASKGGNPKFRWLLAGLIILSSAIILLLFYVSATTCCSN